MVSHDRHFLNNVCTHIVDVDYNKIKIYVGNYDFWYESSQLMQRMIRDQNKKGGGKNPGAAELYRAVLRQQVQVQTGDLPKKLIEKLTPEEMPASSPPVSLRRLYDGSGGGERDSQRRRAEQNGGRA